MKRAVSIICLLALTFSLSACGAGEDLAQENETLRAQLGGAEESFSAAQDEIAALKQALAEAEEETVVLKEQWQAQLEKNSELISQLTEAQQSNWNRDIVTSEKADISAAILRGDVAYLEPWTDAEVKYLFSDMYVEVVMKARVIDIMTGAPSEWYMVRFSESDIGVPFTDFGWVQADKLEEYTYDNMKEIVWPVTLRSGTVVYGDEALTEVLEEQLGNVSVRDLGNGVCLIGASGYGSPMYVRTEDIVYPTP